MKMTRRQLLVAAGSSAALTAINGLAADPKPPAPDPIALGFRNVPNLSRIRMHWYIYGPAWNITEAERELRFMADAKIGGVLIFPAYPVAVDDPAHGIRNSGYLSDEFLAVFRSVVVAANRMGLTVDTVLGTGWPYGGPSVSLEDSAHSIRVRKLPPGTSWETASLAEGQKPVASLVLEHGNFRLLKGGETTQAETQFFYSTPTRMQVKRASLGAEGLVVDPYNAKALQQFLHSVGDKLLDAAPAGSIRSIFSDSLEVYRASWTSDFPDNFAQRWGYDLRPYLPVLFDGEQADSRDVRHDFWGLLSELAGERYVLPLQEWAHSKGVTTQVEAYGTPPVNIASYRAVDIPVGEHYEWKEFSSSRWASSGAHLAGKQIILAESWTWLGLPNRFADTLEQLKLCSDLHFLSGINSLYGLTYSYSPAELGSPGWLPYFGPAINHTTPFWPYFGYLADYVNRASYVVQQGKPVADVAVYLPVEDALAEAPPDQLLLNWAVRDRLSSNGPPPEFSLKNALHYESDVVKGIITNGFAFDGIDTNTMNSGARVEAGRLRLGDGDYSILVLPNLTGIDPESAQRMEEFVASGGLLIATKRLPERAWGLRDRDARSSRVKEIMTRLFGGPVTHLSYRENPFGKGLAIFCADEQGSFRKALTRRQPDIHFQQPSEFVSFVHRRDNTRDFFFVANTSEEPQRLEAVFRVGQRAPEVWDLRTAQIESVPLFERTSAGTRLTFTLGPRESRVFAFSDGPGQPSATHTDLPLEAAGARVFDNGTYFIERSGSRSEIAINGIPAPHLITSPWKLQLDRLTLKLDSLKSWTDIPEARYFSGRGVYEADIRLPAFPGLGVVLDLGGVRETADVHVNGKPAGVAWMRPFRVDITELLKPGSNRLQVDVTNLLLNKILGMGPIDYSQVFAKYGDRFPPGDEWEIVRDPLPSGLLGPVRLVFYKLVKP